MGLNKFSIGTAAAAITFGIALPAHADITGTVNATITLQAGCIVNSQNLDDGATGANFGTVNFGTHNSLFTQADGQILNGGGGALSIQCSPGITPILSFEGGQHDGSGAGSGIHAMAHTSTAGKFVTYNLYSDSGRTAIIPIGGDIALASTGAVQTVNIYARAFGEAALVPGSYTDTVTVVLEL